METLKHSALKQEPTNCDINDCTTNYHTSSTFHKIEQNQDQNDHLEELEDIEYLNYDHLQIEIDNSNQVSTETFEETSNVLNMKNKINLIRERITRSKKYQCLICGKKYSSYSSRKSHFSCHFKKGYKTCLCGRSFIDENIYLTHYFKHFVKKKLICHVCNRRVNGKSKLVNHLFYHLISKTYKCISCLQQFPSISKWSLHKIKYHGKRVKKGLFTCKECDVTFPNRLPLVRHMKIHKLPKYFKNVVFLQLNISTLREYMKDMSCPLCLHTFIHRKHFDDHFLAHFKPKSRNQIHFFKCNVCLLSFSKHEIFEEHLLSHNTNKQQRETYACKICLVQFKLKNIFDNHIRINTLKEPYKCGSCQKEFSLKCHLFTSCVKNIVQCKLCLEKFSSANLLWDHMKSHAQYNQFACNICSQFFEINLDYYVVANVFNHTCTICYQRILQKEKLLTHVKRHISDVRFSCQSCCKKLKTNSNIKELKTIKLFI